MARIRTIKPEFFRHEGLQDIEVANPGKHAMLVFAGLWGHCDKAGRFEWKPRSLKLDILPFLDFDMADTLDLLWRSGFVHRYESEGREYGEIASFEKHQRIGGKEAQEPAKHPEPTEYKQGSIGEATGKHSGLQEGKGREKEEEGKGKERNDVALRARREQVATIFDHWRTTMNHTRAVLDAKRKKVIEERLKDGHSVESLCKAISGCSKTPWNMGENPSGGRYDSLDLILRDAEQIDRFIRYDDEPPRPKGKQAQLEAVNQSAIDDFVGDGFTGGQTYEGRTFNA